MNNGVNEIRVELRSIRDSLNEHTDRLARVETMAENNSHRLDALEGKKN